MSTIGNEIWGQAAIEAFDYNLKKGDYVSCSEIIGDCQSMTLDILAQEFARDMLNTPVLLFAQPSDYVHL